MALMMLFSNFFISSVTLSVQFFSLSTWEATDNYHIDDNVPLIMMMAIKDDDGQPEWRWLFAKLCLQVRLAAFSSVSSTAMVVMLSSVRIVVD